MSYLDDADHHWQLDPSVVTEEPRYLYELIQELYNREFNLPPGVDAGLRTILQGYAGLKARHPEATDEQCLETSMIWWYG